MVISASPSHEGPPEAIAARRFALGLGLTNECNLACAFCYRDPTRVDRLSIEQVRSVMRSLPVRSVNLGTGENGMHPEFGALVHYLRSEPIKLTITSNGYSIEALDNADVKAFQKASLAGEYYESFNVNSRNFMEKSKSTRGWIAESHRLLERCVEQAKTADPAEVRQAFFVHSGVIERTDAAVDQVAGQREAE